MSEARHLCERGLEQLDIPFTASQIRAFLVYLDELKKWNRAYNLTGLQSDADIVIKHFLDSLLFLKVLPGDVRSVADIGSGAGFPGIPMKIMQPGLDVVLVEPAQKKALFLQHMQRTLRLERIEVVNKRIEDVHGTTVDVAVTRALFRIPEFVAKAERILKENGMLVLSKGPKVEDEIPRDTEREIRRCDIVLPFQNIVRHLIIIRRKQPGHGGERGDIIV
jgi:16S rRNA (guanine527-N7)-methyltransferase